MRVAIWTAALLSVFAALVSHHSFVCDDAFVSFRYATNLAEGHGLVFTPGERVEGYTNFSWVLLLAGLARLGIAPESAALVLGPVAAAATLALVVLAGMRWFGRESALAWLPAIALACNRSFSGWATGGLETALFGLLITAAALQFARERAGERARPWPSALLFALASLTRPEGVMLAALAGGFLTFDVMRARRSLRSLGIWIATAVPLVALHAAWRLAYYGAALPNTFYAKVPGPWLEQGATYLGLFASDHLLWAGAVPVAIALVRRPRFEDAWLATVLAVYCAYVLAVGGDRLEYRFMAPLLPMLFLLMARGVARAGEWLAERGVAPALSHSILAALVLVCAIAPTIRGFAPRHGLASLETMDAYAARRASDGRFLRELVEQGLLPADTWLAAMGAGALPYYSRLPAFDVYGLTDAKVARQAIDERGVVGHEKKASASHLRKRGAAIVDVRNRITIAANGNTPDEDELRAIEAREGLPVHVLRANGRTLVFATALEPDEFERRFARFEHLR